MKGKLKLAAVVASALVLLAGLAGCSKAGRKPSMLPSPLPQRLGAEFLGTAFLLTTVIGSGIMGERLSGGNVAIALLGNTIPTGAILFVLITMLARVSQRV